MCCSVLQCAHWKRVSRASSWAHILNMNHRNRMPATYCNTLQHTATHRTTSQPLNLSLTELKHTAPRCTALQHTATHYTAPQHNATHCTTLYHTATHCTTLQHIAPHCITLHHTATRSNTLQHTATQKHTTLYHASPDIVCCSVLQCVAVTFSVLQ